MTELMITNNNTIYDQRRFCVIGARSQSDVFDDPTTVI